MTKDEEGTGYETTCSCLDDVKRQWTIDGERTHTTLRGHIFPVFSCLPHHIDLLLPIWRKPFFGFRPTPSCQFSLACRPQMFPRPPGRGMRQFSSVRTGGRRRNPPASNHHARSLTPFVRYRHDACLLRNGRRGDERNEKPGRGTGRETGRWTGRIIERPQVKEKRAGCRHPASLPACSVLRL